MSPVDPENPVKLELVDPDAQLMLQVRDGSAAAFERLVEKYQTRLIAILEHLVPGKGQAEDMAQEVFMRVYRARKSYQASAKFSTWLFTIANNVASNAIRRLSRNREFNLQVSQSGRTLARPLESMIKDASGLMPARQLDRAETSEIVRLAIQALPERQRMALLLAKYEHMDYEEIGKTMTMSRQAVKSLVSRARANLRDILQPYISAGSMTSPQVPTDRESAGP